MSKHCYGGELPQNYFWTLMANFTFIFLEGFVGRCPTPISLVLSCIVVLEKLSDTCFFLSAQIGFLGTKTTPENWGTKYPSNCFTGKISSQWEMKNVIFSNSSKNFYAVNHPKILFHYTKNFQTGVNSGKKIWNKNILFAIIK